VLADAYIHELGENETQVGVLMDVADPARYMPTIPRRRLADL
jgi:hypothetical protein